MKPGNPVNHRITGFDHQPGPNKPGTNNPSSKHELPGFRLTGSSSALALYATPLVQHPITARGEPTSCLGTAPRAPQRT